MLFRVEIYFPTAHNFPKSLVLITKLNFYTNCYRSLHTSECNATFCPSLNKKSFQSHFYSGDFSERRRLWENVCFCSGLSKEEISVANHVHLRASVLSGSILGCEPAQISPLTSSISLLLSIR